MGRHESMDTEEHFPRFLIAHQSLLDEDEFDF